MVTIDTDSPMIKKAKKAIKDDLMNRYTGPATKDMLGLSAALDPRYKNLAWMTEEDKEDVFKKILKEAVSVAATVSGAPPLNLNIKTESEDTFTPHQHPLLAILLFFLLFHPSLKLLFPLSQHQVKFRRRGRGIYF